MRLLKAISQLTWLTKEYIFLLVTSISIEYRRSFKRYSQADTNIRFIGLLEKSGHLYSGGPIEGIVQHLIGRNSEVSLSQTAHIVQMRKNFSTDWEISSIWSMPMIKS